MNNDRVWEATPGGYATRQATPFELEKQKLFDRWARRELTYKEVLKEIHDRHLG